MRTYKNLAKRINVVKDELNALPNELRFKDLAKAYKLQRYLIRTYESLLTKNVTVKFSEK